MPARFNFDGTLHSIWSDNQWVPGERVALVAKNDEVVIVYLKPPLASFPASSSYTGREIASFFVGLDAGGEEIWNTLTGRG